jgi:hypothetical protein
LENKDNGISIGLFVRVSIDETGSFHISQTEVADNAGKQHPQQYLVLGADGVMTDYHVAVVANSVTDTGKFRFTYGRHLNDYTTTLRGKTMNGNRTPSSMERRPLY